MNKIGIIAACLIALCAQGQPLTETTRLWKGDIKAMGQSLTLYLRVEQKNDSITAYWKIPAQGVPRLDANKARESADSLWIETTAIKAYFKAKKYPNGALAGVWNQGGTDYPMYMEVSSATDAKSAPKRPQTPQPPFPYVSDNLTYTDAQTGWTYGATLTKPNNTGRFPVMVLISGSGAQDRDESILGHKPFAVLADYLTRKGWAVLRVDDRGVGQTQGPGNAFTTLDFVKDAEAHWRFLQNRSDILPSSIWYAGHSEGGYIAATMAAAHPEVAGIVLLAGPGVNTKRLMMAQNKAILSSSGMDPDYISAYLQLYEKLFDLAVSQAPDALKTAASQAVADWRKQHSEATVRNTTGIKDEASEQSFVSAFVKELSDPWWKTFAQLDPAPLFTKIIQPVLALNGSKDVQVVAEVNLAGLRQGLSHNPKAKVVALEGLNHLFQPCKICTVGEYGQIETTIAPEALETIGAFLQTYLPTKKGNQGAKRSKVQSKSGAKR